LKRLRWSAARLAKALVRRSMASSIAAIRLATAASWIFGEVWRALAALSEAAREAAITLGLKRN
jgi:hypothetical protein